jgi:diguanylate cyclase (GGDEF)-like protein
VTHRPLRPSLIASQIDQLSGLIPRPLAFPRELEADFEAKTGNDRCRRLWIEGLVAIIMFDLFLLVDHLAPASIFDRALIVRLGIITPLALVINVLLLRNPGKIFREFSITGICCLVGLSHLYIESNWNAVASAYAQTGMVAVLVFANTMMRLRLPYALASSAILLLGDCYFLYSDVLLSHTQKMLGFGLTLITASVTLISNYSSNREERLQFLLVLRSETLVERLNLSNARLAEIAERDALTGLSSRHAFDSKFEELYNASLRKGSVLSVVMVDVDHFKDINDTYGHLYGDKILRRIANLVVEALRVEGDFAARFGGEEFVLLLPETGAMAAIMVAERLRKLVEVAGFPPNQIAREAFHRITATVSCGISASRPENPGTRHELLEAADKALYRAKEDGRNNVRCAP